MVKFIDRNGNILEGEIIRQYQAWEGDYRYIIKTSNDREYRCVKTKDGIYKELII